MRICKNCKNYFVSGLFQDWGGGSGYCLLIQLDKDNQVFTETGIPKANVKAIKHDKDSCNKIERKLSASNRVDDREP